MSDKKLHIVIAESAPIISTGLAHTLSHLPEFPARLIEIKSPETLPEYMKTDSPDILVVNPLFGGIFDPSQIRTLSPDTKIIAVETAPLDKNARQLFDESIAITDDIDTISRKIGSLSSDTQQDTPSKEPLSQREKEIIGLVVKGLTNKEIADALFLSVHTVITHRRNIARKLEIHSATGLTIYAIVNKLVDISELHL